MKRQSTPSYRVYGFLIALLLVVAGCGDVAGPAVVAAALPVTIARPTPTLIPFPTATPLSVAQMLSPTVTSVTVASVTLTGVTVTAVTMPGMDMPTVATLVPPVQTAVMTSTLPGTPGAVAATPAITSTEFVIDWILFGTPTTTPSGSSISDIPAASPQSADSSAAATSAPTLISPTLAPASPTILATGNAVISAVSDTGDAKRGQALFTGVGTCSTCHDVATGNTLVGPSLKGVASRAGSRKPGMSASDYLRESILKPNAFIVPGFSSGIMSQTFAQTLSASQINDLIAYLLTLK